MLARRLAFAFLVVTLLASCRKSELPLLFVLPNTPLVDEQGRVTPLDSLHGKVAIYDFIFTSCSGTCPVLTKRMGEVVAAIPDAANLRFVSISVDPEHDRPAVLKAYADRVRRDSRWLFFTGDKKAIRSLSVDGFKLAAGDATTSPGEPILHSTKFVLVDRTGTVRAYYDSNDPAARTRLISDAKELLDE